MTDSQTSATTKLAQILQDACQLDGKILISDVWKQVLKFQPDRDGIIENKYLTMLQLFPYARSEINRLSIDDVKKEKYSKAIDTILSGLFNAPMNSAWNQVFPRIGKNNIDLLESCGDIIIFGREGVKDISDAEAKEILSSIISLISEIEDLDIDKNIKQNLVQKLNKIVRSLEDYQVFGSIIFQRLVDESFIEIATLDKTIDKSEWSENITDKFKNVVDTLFKLATIGSTLEKIYPHIEPLAEQALHLLSQGK